MVRNAQRAVRRASGRRKAWLRQAINHLEKLIGRTERVVDQARSRLAGVMPDSSSRLVSLHDADARPIRKGRLGKPVEFGYKAQVVDNADGVILDHSVEGRINHLKRSYGWNRTELTGITGARTWCGHGVFAHNLVKISTLAA